MGSLGAPEVLVVLIVALIVLGPTKLPEAGRQMGRALAEFRKWSSGMQDELRDAFNTEHQPAAPAPPASSTESTMPAIVDAEAHETPAEHDGLPEQIALRTPTPADLDPPASGDDG
jgi:sec-independent protein translocase protein TatA